MMNGANNTTPHCVGDAGHTIKFGCTTITDTEKARMRELNGCPVNKNIPTRMSRASFRKACLKFQEHAGLLKGKNKQNGKHVRMTTHGFRSNNKQVCTECSTGYLVRRNEKFEPPAKVEFVQIPLLVPKHPLSREGSRKLTETDVLKIRHLHQEGYAIVELQELWPTVGCSCISDIVNGKTWKHI